MSEQPETEWKWQFQAKGQAALTTLMDLNEKKKETAYQLILKQTKNYSDQGQFRLQDIVSAVRLEPSISKIHHPICQFYLTTFPTLLANYVRQLVGVVPGQFLSTRNCTK